jgi:hypothetical protein
MGVELPVPEMPPWLEFSDVVGSSGAKSFVEQDAQDDQS